MARCDRLTALQVRIARHHRVRIGIGSVHQRALKIAHGSNKRIDLCPTIESRVGGNLVIARTSGMQLRTRRADATRQLRLDVHVDVFERRFEFKAARLNVRTNCQQTRFDGREVTAVLVSVAQSFPASCCASRLWDKANS